MSKKQTDEQAVAGGRDLKRLFAELREKYGDESITKAATVEEVERLPTGIPVLDEMIGGGWPKGRISELWGPECLSPDALVLMADLSWRRAGTLTVGDDLISVDEARPKVRGSKRKMRRASVTFVGRATKAIVRVVSDRGSSVVSREHPFLVVDGRGSRWVLASDLKAGDEVGFFGAPWFADESRDGGWMAGILDGEGCVTAGQNARVSVAQALGPTQERIKAWLDEREYPYTEIVKRGWSLQGGRRVDNKIIWKPVLKSRYHAMRLLGSVRPGRLLAKADGLWDGLKMANPPRATVVSVDRLGRGEVVTLQTTTGTLISDGFVTHNSSGKTTIAYHSMRAAQAASGGDVLYVDLENTFSPKWAKLCGVDVDRVWRVKAMAAEDAGELIVKVVREGWPLVVLDSVVEMVPEKELQKEVGRGKLGVLSSLLANMLPKIVVLQSMSPTVMLIINQVRDKIGFMFGEGQRAPGGHALYHLDSLRIRVQRKEYERERVSVKEFGKTVNRDVKVGARVALRVEKSKVCQEGRSTTLHMYFGYGLWWPEMGPEPDRKEIARQALMSSQVGEAAKDEEED